jgi:hypothetical protein
MTAAATDKNGTGGGGSPSSQLLLVRRVQVVNDDAMFLADVLVRDGIIVYVN